ncbi:hypothetical protein ACIP4Y_34705 [Streptomyces sp. NPDC088810]|uniref:hypothetical protein n=1 Tax=Streptomyces sp. NPDC088810 TaxID=3365904 RepID=UPI003825E2FE
MPAEPRAPGPAASASDTHSREAEPCPVEQLLDLLQQRVTELRTERCEVAYEPGTGQPAGTPRPVDPAPAEDAPLAGPAPADARPCTSDRRCRLADKAPPTRTDARGTRTAGARPGGLGWRRPFR